MNRRALLATGLACPALASSTFASAALAWAAAPDPAARADDIIRRFMADRHVPGLQAVAVKDGAVVFSRTYGVADLASGTRATPTSAFPINSITKAFTGVAAMREVQAGRLDLEKPIGTYVDGLPQAWRDIQVRRLLSHTSGLPDFVPRQKDGAVDEATAWKEAEAAPVLFPPGERFHYCQTNYALVQMAIDRLHGRPVTEPLGGEQFAIAGMTASRYGDSRDPGPSRVTSYGYRKESPNQPTVRKEVFSPLARAAAGLDSTGDDMGRWMIALMDGRLLDAKARKTMWTQVAYNDGQPGQWGLGWLVLERPDRLVVGMTGGSRNAVYLYPDDGVGVAILSNLAGGTPEDVIDEIAQAFIPGMRLTGVAALRAALADQPKSAFGKVIAGLRQDPAFKPSEHELNDWGYRLLAFGDTAKALAVLALAAALFPQSGNAQDSLAEAYAANGDRAAAIDHYRRSLALDPGNTNAVNRLKGLEATAR
jgi:CubicO group peptidase (beta-lactamase class C family)